MCKFYLALCCLCLLLDLFWSRRCSFPARFLRFGPLHTPNHLKTKAKRNDQAIGVDDGKSCPLQHMYDPDIHDALANLRRLDGSIPVHDKYGPPVNFFAPSGSRKYWVKQSTPVLGCVYDMLIILFIVIIWFIYFIEIILIISNFAPGFSFFSPWIKLCAPSFPSTLTCRYGIPLMKRHLTRFWMLKWICKQCPHP